MRNDTTLSVMEDLECVDPNLICPKILKRLSSLYDNSQGCLPVICFAGKCTRVTGSIFPSDVTLVISLDSIYCLDKTGHIQRSIPLKDVIEVVQGFELWIGIKTKNQFDLLIKPLERKEGRNLLEIVLSVVIKTIGVSIKVKTVNKQKQLREHLNLKKPRGHTDESNLSIIRCAPSDLVIEIVKANRGLIEKKKRQTLSNMSDTLPGSPRRSLMSANRSMTTIHRNNSSSVNLLTSFTSSEDANSSSHHSECPSRIDKVSDEITTKQLDPINDINLLDDLDDVLVGLESIPTTSSFDFPQSGRMLDVNDIALLLESAPGFKINPSLVSSPSSSSPREIPPRIDTTSFDSESPTSVSSSREVGNTIPNTDGKRTQLKVLNLSFATSVESSGSPLECDSSNSKLNQPVLQQTLQPMYPPIALPSRSGTAVLIDSNFKTQRITKNFLLSKGLSVTQCITVADAASVIHESHLIFISATLAVQQSAVSTLQMIKSKPYRPRIVVTVTSSTELNSLFPVLDNVVVANDIPTFINRLRGGSIPSF